MCHRLAECVTANRVQFIGIKSSTPFCRPGTPLEHHEHGWNTAPPCGKPATRHRDAGPQMGTPRGHLEQSAGQSSHLAKANRPTRAKPEATQGRMTIMA